MLNFSPLWLPFCKHPLTCLSIDFSSLSSHCPPPPPSRPPLPSPPSFSSASPQPLPHSSVVDANWFIYLFYACCPGNLWQVMTFSESTLRSLNSFFDLCFTQAYLFAHPLCPICSPTLPPFPSFTISPSLLLPSFCQCIFNSPRYWWCIVHVYVCVSEAHLKRWLTPGPLLLRPPSSAAIVLVHRGIGRTVQVPGSWEGRVGWGSKLRERMREGVMGWSSGWRFA